MTIFYSTFSDRTFDVRNALVIFGIFNLIKRVLLNVNKLSFVWYNKQDNNIKFNEQCLLNI